MGRMKSDALGSATGGVGGMIFSKWKGIRTVRMKGERSSKKSTEAQEIHKLKFRIVTRFISSMPILLNTTYGDRARQMSGSNAAFGRIITDKIIGTYPDLQIDFPNVYVASGSLPEPGIPRGVTASGGGVLTFNWDDNSGTHTAKEDDVAIFIAYSDELGATDYVFGPATRKDETGTMIASRLIGREVHTWLSFISKDKRIANSVYTGKVTVL